MSDENTNETPDIDPVEATTEADVSDGREQKLAPVAESDTKVETKES